MKEFHTLHVLILLAYFSFNANAHRDVVSLNQEWDFKGASIWEENVEETINLPHTWNANDAARGYKYFRGEGIYLKSYFADKSLKDKRLFLKFEGVQTVANVSVNGKYLGEHRGGYSAFSFEITDAVKFGEENLIEVKVDNSKTEDVLPLGGDFNIYGGIHRPVQLIITDKTCITPLDFASPGVFLIQKNVSNDLAEIDVLTKISNGSLMDESLDVEISVEDAHGNVVVTGSERVSVAAASNGESLISLKMKDPHLWNGVKDPYLYSAKVTLKKDGNIVDELLQPLGLRYYSTDAEKGFFLNGEHMKIKGVSRHNDYAGVGSALLNKHHQTDMDLIAEMGANGVRLAHYQHTEFFYSLCDSTGMVVWAEIPFVGSDQKGFADSEQFRTNAKQQLIELIRQNYNHPSILFWGLYNEIGRRNDSVLTDIIDNLHDIARNEDPTRETVAASFIPRSEDSLHKIPEMIAWNQYYGWYYSKPYKLGDFLDRIHEEEPSYKIGISEYGAGGSVFHHEEKIRRPFPFFHPWHPEEFQTTVHEGNWKAIAERPFVWGSYIWNMFDFGSHFRREGDAIGMNDKGMVSYDRKTKKDAFFFYKANWSEEPVIHITNTRFAIREKDEIKVKVYSNLEDVELFVNGKSKGKKEGEYATLLWEDVTLKKGNNLVKAVGQKDGKSYTSSVVWMYEKNPAISLTITFLRWLIKPFVIILLVLAFWFIRMLVKKQVKKWRKAMVIIALIIVILILLVLTAAQIMGAKQGLNIFEYSLI